MLAGRLRDWHSRHSRVARPAGIPGATGDNGGSASGRLDVIRASQGFVLWERAAQRIAAAATAAGAGTGPPGPCRYAALIYVDRPIPANGWE